jgi:hypothetical protein
MIEFTKDRWFLALWFIQSSEKAYETIGAPNGSGGHLCDCYAALFCDKDGPWQFVYRFRYGTRTSGPGQGRAALV